MLGCIYSFTANGCVVVVGSVWHICSPFCCQIFDKAAKLQCSFITFLCVQVVLWHVSSAVVLCH